MSIQVKNLTHIYNKNLPHEQKALDDVSFDIEDGKFIGIIGHTGSGKSTLVQHLNGLLKPDAGSIIINGIDITSKEVVMRDIRKKVGLVFQYPEYQLFEETVAKDVAFGPLNLGFDAQEVSALVEDALEMVGLNYEKFGDRPPFELSGGQKRRVAIAGVLAMKPEVLILDEPTAGLDPKAHKEILKMIQTVHKYEKNTIILVSHNMNDIAMLSEQVLVMKDGRLFMDGMPCEIFSQEKKLKSIGLDIPDVTSIVNRLYDSGIDVKKNIFDFDEAVLAVTNALKGKTE